MHICHNMGKFVNTNDFIRDWSWWIVALNDDGDGRGPTGSVAIAWY